MKKLGGEYYEMEITGDVVTRDGTVIETLTEFIPGEAVRVINGKYHGCILTYVKSSVLGHTVIIDGSEKTLERCSTLERYSDYLPSGAMAQKLGHAGSNAMVCVKIANKFYTVRKCIVEPNNNGVLLYAD